MEVEHFTRRPLTPKRKAVIERLIEQANEHPLVFREIPCGCPAIGTPHLPHYEIVKEQND